MFEVTYLVAILLGLFLFILGWFISKMVGAKKTDDLKPKYEALQKDYTSVEKQLKKKTTQTEQLKKKNEVLQESSETALQESNDLTQKRDSQIVDLQSKLSEQKSVYDTVKLDKDRLTTTSERTKKELENLKGKYERDVGSGKEWRKDREVMEREVESLSTKLKRQTELKEEYQTKYTEQAEDVAKLRATRKELRMLKSTTRALEKDVAYWEKKHYDTHHELAGLKKDTEGIFIKNNELEDLRKADAEERSKLMEQIQEYKTKFVDVNNKYREITSKG